MDGADLHGVSFGDAVAGSGLTMVHVCIVYQFSIDPSMVAGRLMQPTTKPTSGRPVILYGER
jgi:hypothetical protein